MAKTYKQLNLFGESKPKRIYKRDRLGRFSNTEMSNEEKLFRENNKLKVDCEMWRRKAEALAKLIGHKNLTSYGSN
jgi:hypothetical protein